MQLDIYNLAKIESAKITLDGITIIAGNNNTGKSTVGKVLCAVFSALSNMDERVFNLKQNSVSRVVSDELAADLIWENSITSLISRFVKGDISVEHLVDAVIHKTGKGGENRTKAIDRLVSIRDIPMVDLKSTVLRRYFDSVFNQQLQPLVPGHDATQIVLTVKGRPINIEFSGKSCRHNTTIRLIHKARYIDDPGVLSFLNSGYWGFFDVNTFTSELVSDVLSKRRKATANPAAGAIDDILNEEKFTAIGELFQSALDGEVVVSPNKEFVFKDHKLSANLLLANLSMGMKSLALLQTLLKFGVLNAEDVLVLDEPEVHLHPEWQLIYAELIVLLQKEFHLTILLTSHSPDFIQAVRLFSKKHDVFNKVNAYLAYTNGNGMSNLNHVNKDDWDSVFDKFLPAIDQLANLRESIEED